MKFFGCPVRENDLEHGVLWGGKIWAALALGVGAEEADESGNCVHAQIYRRTNKNGCLFDGQPLL
jgi:hypothetical protein